MATNEREYLLNKVDGFNPYNHLEPATDQATGEELTGLDGEKMFFLPARMQETWFRLKNPSGRISLEQIDAPHDCVKFRARVYEDKKDGENEYIAEALAEKAVIKDAAFPPFESCQTIAIARALTIAGFGCEIKAFVGGETMKQGDAGTPELKADDLNKTIEDVFSPDGSESELPDNKPASNRPRKKAEANTEKTKPETVSEGNNTTLEQFLEGVKKETAPGETKAQPKMEESTETENPVEIEEEFGSPEITESENDLSELEPLDTETSVELEDEYEDALKVVFTFNSDKKGPLDAHKGKTLGAMKDNPETSKIFNVVANSASLKAILPEDVLQAMLTVYSKMQ
jgi:hypothetical protein